MNCATFMRLPDDAIRILVVYQNPSDYPGKFVVREQAMTRGHIVKATNPMIVCDTLEQARSVIPGGHRFDRAPEEDPVIVESWML